MFETNGILRQMQKLLLYFEAFKNTLLVNKTIMSHVQIRALGRLHTAIIQVPSFTYNSQVVEGRLRFIVRTH